MSLLVVLASTFYVVRVMYGGDDNDSSKFIDDIQKSEGMAKTFQKEWHPDLKDVGRAGYMRGGRPPQTQQCTAQGGVRAPHFYPFPEFNMVVGKTDTSCEFVASTCEDFSAGRTGYPEGFVRETIASFLVPCLQRPCLALDLGSNVGYVSSYMLALGAKVVSVEPQLDLARTLESTARVNCWSDRLIVHNAYVSWKPEDEGNTMTRAHLWRPDDTAARNDKLIEKPYFVLPTFLNTTTYIDFIKLDIDSYETEIVSFFADYIAQNTFRFGSLIFEVNLGHNVDKLANALHKFQAELGYDIYKMNQHEQRRWFDSAGKDVYQPGTRAYADTPWYEERYSMRFMRFILFIKQMPSVSAWKECLLQGIKKREDDVGRKSFTNSFLITREQLMEPANLEKFGQVSPSTYGADYWKGRR